jgi:hypothetical protein
MSFDWGAAEAAVTAWEQGDELPKSAAAVHESEGAGIAAAAAGAAAAAPEYTNPAVAPTLAGETPDVPKPDLLSTYANLAAQVDESHLLSQPASIGGATSFSHHESHALLAAQTARPSDDGRAKKDKPVAQKRPKRDPRKPKAPMSAYLFYCSEMRAKTAVSHPEMTPVERTKMVGQWWNAMGAEQKQPYTDRATDDKARHIREMAEWDTPEARSAREKEDADAEEAKVAAGQAKLAAKTAADEAKLTAKLAAEESKKAARLAKEEAKAASKAAQKAAGKVAQKAKPAAGKGAGKAAPKRSQKRKAPDKPTGPPPSGGDRTPGGADSAQHDASDGEVGAPGDVLVEGEGWAPQFRRAWQREKLAWTQKPNQGRKTKWPLQAAVDNKRWGEDFALRFWYRRFQICKKGPWQRVTIGSGRALSAEEEAKAAQDIREGFLKNKPDLLQQKPSWLIEQKVDGSEGETSEPGRVKLVLPASGCPPSHSQSSKRKPDALEKYLFEKRPRAPRPQKKASSKAEQKRQRLGVDEDGGHRRRVDGSFDRRSRSLAAATIVEPADSVGSEALAKEDWEEARRLPVGVGVDAQIRAVLGIIVRHVELEHHQESRWIEVDKEVDTAGRASHTKHTVPNAIRATMQDMMTSIAGVDVDARSVKRVMKSTLKHTQHSGYAHVRAAAKPQEPLDIYNTLRDRRLGEYRKLENDAANLGYLRKRRQIWDGVSNTKGLKWKGGDHVLLIVPRHAETSTLTAGELAKIKMPPPTAAQTAAGLEDFATPDSFGIKAVLGTSLGFAAATCTFVRNGVLSVEFMDGDVLGGTFSGEYICHTSEIQTGWSPRSERPFQR